MKKCCGFDLEQRWIERRVRSIRQRLAQTLGRCDLIVLRDPKSLEVLRLCAPFPDAVAGADTAVLQKQCAPEALPWSESERDLFRSDSMRLAVCVSEQNQLRDGVGTNYHPSPRSQQLLADQVTEALRAWMAE